MRCLALAQMFQRTGGHVVFAMAESTPALEEIIVKGGFEVTPLSVARGSVIDARETISIACSKGAAWVVADGYHFGHSFQEEIKRHNLPLLLLDDYGHAERYCADFVLNQNLGASIDAYRLREAQTKLLLGTSYALLRTEFLRQKKVQRPVAHKAARVLVTLGGSDSDNVTNKVIESLALLEPVEALVVVGGSNPHLELLEEACKSIQLVMNASNMPDLMASADVAITAGGTTVWEAAFMGLPMLTIVLAENQRLVCDQLQAEGLSRNLGWHKDLSPPRIANAVQELLTDTVSRAAMSARGQQLVDGRGSLRVWLRLNENALHLRPVSEGDSRLIWEWANQPAVRAVSFNSDLISWDDHVHWFSERLANPSCLFWLAADKEGQALGQVRFEIQGEEATISVSLDSVQQGRQLGVLLIWAACRRLLRETDVQSINAYVKLENTASSHAFEKANFKRMSDTLIKQLPAMHYIFSQKEADL